ncbi:hypothetical protein HK105_200512 [Polyrhizophydium stewartii]|uniref:DUF221-domain-containing protein n=1 Tax=Polyrhizophydium stewartii TaxID=2732419 RepID=A0ABR4NJA1_9FUNG
MRHRGNRASPGAARAGRPPAAALPADREPGLQNTPFSARSRPAVSSPAAAILAVLVAAVSAAASSSAPTSLLAPNTTTAVADAPRRWPPPPSRTARLLETPTADPTKRRSNQGILVPLTTFVSVGLACFLTFCIVRTCFLDIYSPRRVLTRGRPPRLRKGLFSWIPVVFRTKENVLINTVGLDAIMLLRFFKMGYRMFAVFTVLGMGVLAPVNFYAHPPPLANATTGYQIEDLMLPALSVDNVPNKSKYLRVHMAFTWLFSLLTIAYVVAHYRGFVRLKMQYDEHALRQTKMSKIEMRSVMVFGIPREMRNEIDLASYFESLGVGNVESVVLCRNWSHLRNAIQKRAHFLNKLETVFAQVARRHAANERTSCLGWLLGCCGLCIPRPRPGAAPSARNGRREILRGNSAVRVSSLLSPEHAPLLPRGAFASTESVNPAAIEVLSRIDAMNSSWRPQHRTGFLGLFGTLVDSAEFYAAKFHEWDRLVERFRRMPERSAPTAVGIVTFESPVSATLVSQAVLQRRPFACMTKMAPEPRDMYWPNLSSKTASSYTKAIRGLLVYGSLFMLVFFSTFIVSSIAGLIDLGQLAVYVPVLGAILKDIPDTWIQFIQGVIPAALLTLWTSSLPSVLLILCQIQGIEASSWIEMSLLTKYFSYQLWNILFLTVFARTFVYEIIPNPQMVIELLGQMVPKSSTTLINYVILQAAAVYPAQLLLVAPLILTWLSRFSPLSRSTPRQTSDAYYPSVLTCINYGVAYPVPMIIFVIGVVYAPIAPLILPFCALFFAVGYFVYKYLLMYVHLPRYESKGIATRLVVNRCLSSLIIMQLTMMGLLALKASGDGARKKAGQGGMQTLLSEPTPWSDYAQMVSGVLPLLAITMFVYGWLSQGYDKQIIHIPLEILGKIANEFATRAHDGQDPASPPSGSAGAGAGANRRAVIPLISGSAVPGVGTGVPASASSSLASSMHDIRGMSSSRLSVGRELNDFAARRPITVQSRHRDGLTRLSTSSGAGRQGSSTAGAAEAHSMGGADATGVHDGSGPSSALSSPDRHASPIQSSSGVRRKLSSMSLQAGQFSIFADPAAAEASPFDAALETDSDPLLSSSDSARRESPRSQANAGSVGSTGGGAMALDAEAQRTMSDEEERLSLGIHLEPPMTRVPGVLDAPVEAASAVLRYGDDAELDGHAARRRSTDTDPAREDIQLRTYVHPALIGKLPVPWLPGREQPQRLVELREEQARTQREVWRRLVAQQRVGMQAATEDDHLAADGVPDQPGAAPQRNGGRRLPRHSSGPLPTRPDFFDPDDELGLSIDEVHAQSRAGRGRGGPVLGRIRSFVDGFTSWVHLTMS